MLNVYFPFCDTELASNHASVVFLTEKRLEQRGKDAVWEAIR